MVDTGLRDSLTDTAGYDKWDNKVKQSYTEKTIIDLLINYSKGTQNNDNCRLVGTVLRPIFCGTVHD